MKFHSLTVTDVRSTTRQAVVVTLKAPHDVDFSFKQGQYLTFRKSFEGVELRRCYSICSSPQSGELQVGIKHVDGGAFSSWANTELQKGDTLESLTPLGNFYQSAVYTASPHYLLVAAGSGITPILSILEAGLTEESDAKFTLLYGNRNSNTIMFREVLEDLKDRFLDRLSILHVLTDNGQDIDLFHGRIDNDKCVQLFSQWLNVETVDAAYICGPESMMNAVKNALTNHGMDKSCIHVELFTGSQTGRLKTPAASFNTSTKGVKARVTLGGETRELTIKSQQSLLEAALENQVEAPYACRAGVCSTCKAKVIEGDVEMVANHALQDDEVNAGYVLTCQCYPTSDSVVWDYDQAGH